MASPLEVRVTRREAPDEELTLKFDGEEFGYSQPTEGQLLLAMATLGNENANDGYQLGALLLFMKGVLEPRAYAHLRGVLNNPLVEDPADVVMDLFHVVTESMTGDPTLSSSDSSPSPRSTGARSTATSRARASTPSASRRASSRTSSTSSLQKG